MKIFFTILPLVIAICSSSQQAVAWTIQAKPTNDSQYIVTAEGKVTRGWHVYAQMDSALGLEPASIRYDNDVIITFQDDQTSASFLRDPLFNHQLVKIYDGDIRLQQTIDVKNRSGLKAIIKGYASNNHEFIPFEYTQEIITGTSANPDGKLLNNPVGYTPDERKYMEWLQCGISSLAVLHDGKGKQVL